MPANDPLSFGEPGVGNSWTVALENQRQGSLPKLLLFCLVPAVGVRVPGAAAVGGSSAVVFGVVFGVVLGLLAADRHLSAAILSTQLQ